jgi:hypothetical protein
MIRTITGAKIDLKNHIVYPSIVETLDDNTERTHDKIKCDQLYHPDLKRVFDKLIPHLIVICDQKEAILIEDLENIDGDVLYFDGDSSNEDSKNQRYIVTQFSISGSGESEGISLVGYKKIGEKVLNLNAPFTKYEDDYRFSEELALTIQSCIHEVEEYLNGKYAIKQLEIPEDEIDPDTEFQGKANDAAGAVLDKLGDSIMQHEKKKKGRTRKMHDSVSSDDNSITDVEFEHSEAI